MPVKDYYKILQVEPNADFTTIKKAFRKLAMEYHPDKNEGNQSSTIFFREIQTAYDVLTNPEKRERYHYERWLEKSKGHHLETAISAEQIIQLFINTERVIHETDSFRRDNSIIIDFLLNLYTSNRIELILEKNDPNLEKSTIQLAIQSTKDLPSSLQLRLNEQLKKLLAKHPDMASSWSMGIQNMKKKEFIESLKIPLLILLTVILCLIILLISK